MKKWKSCATWSKIPDSDDTHSTELEAQTIADKLLEEYTPLHPCPIRGICLSSWTEPIINA